MGIKIKKVDHKNITYDVLPETVDPKFIEGIKVERDISSANNGYSQDRTMRKIGSIPQSVLYNYAMMNGIPPEKHGQYYAENKGKNLLNILKEFKSFRTVDKPL